MVFNRTRDAKRNLAAKRGGNNDDGWDNNMLLRIKIFPSPLSLPLPLLCAGQSSPVSIRPGSSVQGRPAHLTETSVLWKGEVPDLDGLYISDLVRPECCPTLNVLHCPFLCSVQPHEARPKWATEDGSSQCFAMGQVHAPSPDSALAIWSR